MRTIKKDELFESFKEIYYNTEDEFESHINEWNNMSEEERTAIIFDTVKPFENTKISTMLRNRYTELFPYMNIVDATAIMAANITYRGYKIK